MKHLIYAFMFFAGALPLRAFVYPTFDKTLPNGMKVIVCEKPGSGFAEVEVWYRVGSKDEKPGIRGMAHLFEHMMFRGTKNISGEQLMEKLDSVGASWNAYTSFDRTVYHEMVPTSAVGMAFMLEADRMANLVVTQQILNTEREVVGQEYRNGISNWYRKMTLDRYELLYPEGHPYEVDVIGHLDEITAFTSEQCMEFYDKYYSPNNAFLIVVGDVQHEQMFHLAQQYFGVITKQLPDAKPLPVQSILSTHVKGNEMEINFPVQIYSYSMVQPAADNKDYFAYTLLMSLLFFNDNSILNERLVKKEQSVYGIINAGEVMSMYETRAQIDFVMPPMPGNVKVKKAIREEIDKVIAEGLPQDKIDDFLSGMEAQMIMGSYSAEGIANMFGEAEYYFRDYKRADSRISDFKKVTQEDIKRVAGIYLAADNIDVINIKPAY
ncbi:MAG: pitrilysin family protein [Bacteroidia bacterium]